MVRLGGRVGDSDRLLRLYPGAPGVRLPLFELEHALIPEDCTPYEDMSDADQAKALAVVQYALERVRSLFPEETRVVLIVDQSAYGKSGSAFGHAVIPEETVLDIYRAFRHKVELLTAQPTGKPS